MATTLIVIVGKSASGKDTLAKELERRLSESNVNSHRVVSMTTRPPRIGEVDGVDYHFSTKDQFGAQVNHGHILEWTEFNHGWLYGTPSWEIHPDEVNIAVLNPEGFYSVCRNSSRLPDFTNTIMIYLDAPLGLRLRRSCAREGGFKWRYVRRALNDFWTFRGLRRMLKKRKHWRPYTYTSFNKVGGSPFGSVFVGEEKSLPEETLCDRILGDIRGIEKGIFNG